MKLQNPEGRSRQNLDSIAFQRTEKRFNLIDEAHEKAQRVIEVDRIDPQNFAGIYGPEEIARDFAETERLKSIYATEGGTPEQRKLGTIFEGIMHEQVELSNWFGENTSTIKTSAYDDYKNGIDEILEFQERNSASYLAVAIDATTSADTEIKFKKIKDEIFTGRLPRIKYFQSEHWGIKGEKEKVPRILIEAHPRTVKKLSQDWLDGRNNELAKNPVQIQMLHQMFMQLETFEIYAGHVGHPEIAAIYQHAKDIVADILVKKGNLIRELEYAAVDMDDGSTYNMRQAMKLVFTELDFG